jgi:hypothetical protein
MNTITIEQARLAAASGGVLSVNLRHVGSMFTLEFETLNGTAMLIASVSKEVRWFSNPAKAFEIVRVLGLDGRCYSVAQWHPEENVLDRPVCSDRSVSLKQAHEAAAYNNWFLQQVEEGIKEADDPATVFISQTDVKKDMAKQRNVLEAKIAASTR